MPISNWAFDFIKEKALSEENAFSKVGKKIFLHHAMIMTMTSWSSFLLLWNVSNHAIGGQK